MRVGWHSPFNDDDFSSQIKLIKENYAEDIKYYYLLPQLEIFKVLMKGKQTNRKFFRYITLNKVKRQKSLAWACHDYCGCTNLQTSFSRSIQSLQQRAKDHFSFLWRAESKPVCALRWPSRDLRVVQSSLLIRQKLTLCDLLMWLKNLSVEMITANVTLEYLYTDADHSYSQLTGLHMINPTWANAKLLRLISFSWYFVNSVWWNPV